MLDSLTIRNFRLFEDLTIERLGRVNLIVGKNNSGKSCLLEAVELYVSRFSPFVLAGILERRNEYGLAHAARYKRPSTLERAQPHPVNHFFRLGDTRVRILIGSATDEDRLWQAMISGYSEIGGSASSELQTLKRIDDGTDELLALFARYFLEVSIANRPGRPVLPLDLEFNDALSRLEKRTAIQAATCVPADGLKDAELGSHWNSISLSDRRETVKKLLRSIFPDIVDVDVAYDTDTGHEPRAKLADGRIVGIGSLGDGVRRLFGILLACVTAEKGTLLIDEIENGLHWSAQESLWQTLFRIAQELDIQIFATTHSRDTIAAFESVWRENEAVGAFHRLERHPRTGKIIASTYALDTLSASVETDFEVR